MKKKNVKFQYLYILFILQIAVFESFCTENVILAPEAPETLYPWGSSKILLAQLSCSIDTKQNRLTFLFLEFYTICKEWRWFLMHDTELANKS